MIGALVRLLIVFPIMIAVYLFAFFLVALIFIAVAAVVAAPFIFIIGMVLWIFF